MVCAPPVQKVREPAGQSGRTLQGRTLTVDLSTAGPSFLAPRTLLLLLDCYVLCIMRFGALTALVAACWIGASTAHNIQLKAHSRECFHEELHRDDKMTVTFQVGDREFGGAGNLDIDFYVCSCPGFVDATTDRCRSWTLRTTMRPRCGLCLLATTPSTRKETADTYTASATRNGQPIPKRCHSTCTASSTSQSQRHPAILLTQKVGRPEIGSATC